MTAPTNCVDRGTGSSSGAPFGTKPDAPLFQNHGEKGGLVLCVFDPRAVGNCSIAFCLLPGVLRNQRNQRNLWIHSGHLASLGALREAPTRHAVKPARQSSFMVPPNPTRPGFAFKGRTCGQDCVDCGLLQIRSRRGKFIGLDRCGGTVDDYLRYNDWLGFQAPNHQLPVVVLNEKEQGANARSVIRNDVRNPSRGRRMSCPNALTF